MQNGETSKADSLFRLAKDLDLFKFRAPEWLGIIMMMKEETTKALSYLEYSNGLDNRDTETLYFLSVANGRNKNFRKSIEYVNRWLELEPKNKRAKYLRGEFWNELQKQNGFANKKEKHASFFTPSRVPLNGTLKVRI